MVIVSHRGRNRRKKKQKEKTRNWGRKESVLSLTRTGKETGCSWSLALCSALQASQNVSQTQGGGLYCTIDIRFLQLPISLKDKHIMYLTEGKQILTH